MRIACALVAAALAACGSNEDRGPSCEQVTEHLLTLMTGTLPGHAGMDLVPRKLMAQRCAEKHYPTKVRICMMEATTMVAAGACSGEKPISQPHQPRTLDLIPASGGSGSAAGSGSGS